VAVIHDFELIGCECFLEAGSNQGNSIDRHGRTCMTGLISTSPNTRSST
jgi:hypothetical protein